jgi:VanZ family protein
MNVCPLVAVISPVAFQTFLYKGSELMKVIIQIITAKSVIVADINGIGSVAVRKC